LEADRLEIFGTESIQRLIFLMLAFLLSKVKAAPYELAEGDQA
jgi:hypothetical protein